MLINAKRQEIPLASVTKKTSHNSLVDKIVEHVSKAVIQGELSPGADLNSVDLARQFGSSRTPVREALLILNRNGLVDLESHRRPRVSEITLKEVRDIYGLRAALYDLVSRSIVVNASREQIAQLESRCEELGRHVSAGNVDAYFWANVAFRDDEAAFCGNDELAGVLNSLRLRTHRFRHLSTSIPGRMARSHLDHQILCRAYAERDAGLASAINRSIVVSALSAIESLWEQKGTHHGK